jgi:hypothetical protein
MIAYIRHKSKVVIESRLYPGGGGIRPVSTNGSRESNGGDTAGRWATWSLRAAAVIALWVAGNALLASQNGVAAIATAVSVVFGVASWGVGRR